MQQSSERSLRQEASSLKSQGQYRQAELRFSQIVARGSATADDFMHRGKCRRHLHRIEDAISDYSEALRLQPDLVVAVNNRAFIYANCLEQPDYDFAYKEYGRAIRMSPQMYLYWQNRSSIYLRMKERNLALSDANKALSLATAAHRNSTTIATSYNLRGKVFSSQKMYREAIRDFSEALELVPTMTRVKTNRGLAYFACGEYRKALADFETISIVDRFKITDKAAVLWRRALCHCHEGDFRSARADVVSANEVDAEFSDLGTMFLEMDSLAGEWRTFCGRIRTHPSVVSLQGLVERFFQEELLEVEEEDWGERDASIQPVQAPVKRRVLKEERRHQMAVAETLDPEPMPVSIPVDPKEKNMGASALLPQVMENPSLMLTMAWIQNFAIIVF